MRPVLIACMLADEASAEALKEIQAEYPVLEFSRIMDKDSKLWKIHMTAKPGQYFNELAVKFTAQRIIRNL